MDRDSDWPGTVRRHRPRIALAAPHAILETPVEVDLRKAGPVPAFRGLAVCRACGYQLAAVSLYGAGSRSKIVLDLWPGAVEQSERHRESALPWYRHTGAAHPERRKPRPALSLRDKVSSPPERDRTHVWIDCPTASCGMGQEIDARRLVALAGVGADPLP
jgi:hypothetical protein